MMNVAGTGTQAGGCWQRNQGCVNDAVNANLLLDDQEEEEEGEEEGELMWVYLLNLV